MEGKLVAGRYELQRHLGTGEFGDVWVAHDRNLGHEVALKLLPANIDSVVVYQEATMLMTLAGEHVLPVYNADRYDDVPYIATKVAAGTAEDELATHPHGLRPDLAVTRTLQALVGLESCHGHGLIHRDVKPANIFLLRPDWAALGDFGAAYQMDRAGQVPPGGDPRVRSTEMMKGGRGDVMSDIYSMGVTLYRLLTGEWPYQHPDWPELKRLVTTGDCRDLRDLSPHVTNALARRVRRAMAVDRRERYQSAKEMHVDLATVDMGRLWQPMVPHPGHRACWSEEPVDRRTPHAICVVSSGPRFAIETRRATGARSRIAAACLDNLRERRVPVELRRIFALLG